MYKGNMGLKRGEQEIPTVLGKCIKLIAVLPAPTRIKVLNGLRAWVMEDACPVLESEDE